MPVGEQGRTVVPPVAGMAAAARLALWAILAAAYFLYAPSLRFPFVYDDIFQIVNNPHLDSWRFLPVYFTQQVWSHAPGVAANFYRPLFLLWLRLNNIAFAHEPAGWHFTTVLLHVLAAGLVYVLGRDSTKSRAAALAAALVFAAHPVHVEAVAWVSGVTEPLSAAFFLGALACYLRQVQAGHGNAWRISSVGLFCAGLLVKETVAVLPFVFLAYEFTVGRGAAGEPEPKLSSLLRKLLPYWVVLGVYLAARSLVLHGVAAVSRPYPLVRSLLTWPWLLCFYLRELFWPAHLSALYDPVQVSRMSQLLFLAPAAVLAGIGLASTWFIRRSRLAGFLLAWFLLTLAPAMLVFCLAPPDQAFHDRYLYLPSVAFALAAGALLAAAWKLGRTSKAVATVAAAVVVLLFAAQTHRQQLFWASNYALFQRAVSVAPNNETAALNFAAELIKTREYERALGLSREAAERHPGSARAWGSAAAASFALRDYATAEKYYARAAQLDPARGDVLHYLGITRMKLGHYAEAIEALRQAAAASPELPGVHYAWGMAEEQLGDWKEAGEQFAAELRLNPADSNAQKALAEVRAHL